MSKSLYERAKELDERLERARIKADAARARREERERRRRANGSEAAPGAAPSEAKQIHRTLTDVGNGVWLATRHGDDIRYCHPWQKWLVWDGRRWAVDATAQALRLAKDTAASIYAEAATAPSDTTREMLGKPAHQSQKRDRLAAMLYMAASEPGIPVLPADLDRDPWLLNVRNGTLNLKSTRRSWPISLACVLSRPSRLGRAGA
jgi:phage/plasmid-associated DNA primase